MEAQRDSWAQGHAATKELVSGEVSNPEMAAKEKAELQSVVTHESKGGSSRPSPAIMAKPALGSSPRQPVGIAILLQATIKIRIFQA